jgi:NADH-dependent peroxiredoxin subunit F
MLYDAIIVGGGPAGLAAAVYLARQKVSFALIAPAVGGQPLWSSDVENYLGFHLLDGATLVAKFKEHLKDYEGAFDLKEGECVEKIERTSKGFSVKTGKGAYEAKTVLIATGEKHRELGIPGEKAFYGRGVTYCATCDAPLFREKDVAVIGGGNSAMDAALFLEKYAKSILMLTVNDALAGDAVMMKKVLASPKIRVAANAKATRVFGDAFVNGIEYEAGGKRETADVEGLFIEIGLVPVSEFIDFVEKDKIGQIIVSVHNETSVPGVFAAGDVTNVTEKQIAVAVGEGSKAALSMIKWLQRNT